MQCKVPFFALRYMCIRVFEWEGQEAWGLHTTRALTCTTLAYLLGAFATVQPDPPLWLDLTRQHPYCYGQNTMLQMEVTGG